MTPKYCTLTLLSLCVSGIATADELAREEPPIENALPSDELIAEKEPLVISTESFLLTASDAIPSDHIKGESDTYLEGYIQALLDVHYYEYKVLVVVRDHHVFLYNLPKNDLMAHSIISFVKDVPEVASVEVKEEPFPKEEAEERDLYVGKHQVEGVWFPQSTVLFQPLIADPRQPMYYAALRLGEKVAGSPAIAVALGDNFPIFRWRDVFRWHGDMQIGIDAGVWAVFNFHNIPKEKKPESCELVNADYMLGIPLTYAVDRWSYRLRVYHISSHLGDEFLVNHPKYIYKRTNPSFEALDFFTSYQFSPHLRVYGGPGWVFHSDPSFKLKPLYVQWGAELRLLGRKLYYHKLYGTPFLAMHMENWEQHHWSIDTNVMMGYEWSKLQGIGRKMRLYVLYHQGYCYDGQFFNERTKYVDIGLSWGF